MARDLPAAVAGEVVKRRLSPLGLVEIATAAGYFRVSSSVGTFRWNGREFEGVGTYGSMSAIEETSDLKAAGVVFNLSGVRTEAISTVLQHIRQGKTAKAWLAVLDADGRLMGDPYLSFSGITDVPTIVEGAEAAEIRLSCESRLFDLQRARVRRYTPEDQKLDDATDEGFDYVAGLQDGQIVWGKA